jgi:energy-converting hydrogenase B subunit D
MTAVQAVALVVVALGGTGVVLARDPARQALVAGIFGFSLAILFLAFQAPDVALSQIVVGAVALPAMILYALRKIQRREEVERTGR